MSTAAVETLSIIDLLAAARSGLVRLDPHAARAAWDAGGLLVDIRPAHQRSEAESTRGHFYEAASKDELRRVYEDMGSSIGFRTKAKEIGQWFIAAALLFAFAAAGMTLLWVSRLL